MGCFTHRVFSVLILTLLLQACGNKGELTLDIPAVNNQNPELTSADEPEPEKGKKKDQRRE